MKQLGEIVKVEQVLAPTRSTSSDLSVERGPDHPPPALDMDCDALIPRQIFSAWKPDHGPREIIRPLTESERDKLSARIRLLKDALRPFSPAESAEVNAELAAMLNGFRSMRQQGEDVAATIEIIRRVLRPFPRWAIAQACMMIARRETDLDPPLDPRWPPNDVQIYDVVQKVVKDHKRSLATAEALLSAPVEQPVLPKPKYADHALGPQKPYVPRVKMGDGRHYERIKADLEVRRARNEVRPIEG